MTHSIFLETIAASPVWEKFNQQKYKITLSNGDNEIEVRFKSLPESFQLAALVDYFRKEHGIHVYPIIHADQYKPKCLLRGNHVNELFDHKPPFMDFEVALRAGILEALKYVP